MEHLWGEVMATEVITDAITGQITTVEIAGPSPAEQLATERAGMVCSRFQAKAALLAAGLLDTIEAVVATADPFAKIAWADATEFRRNSPTIATLATAAGMTDAQIDDLFRVAMTITA
jgi:hypothetical protein